MKQATETVSDKSLNLMPEQEVLRFAYEYPELGQAAVASRLQQAGLKISPSGVRYIWKKHGLETTAKRLKALAADGKGDQLSVNQQKRLDRNLLTDDLRGKEVIAGGFEGGRRSILLNTAAELFAEKGFDRTEVYPVFWTDSLGIIFFKHETLSPVYEYLPQ